MSIAHWLSAAFGLDVPVQQLAAWQMVLRACFIYLFTLVALRAGKRRFLGKNSALDIVIMIIVGSVMSRAINGNAPLFPTAAAGLAMVLLHRLLAWLSVRWTRVGHLVEGRPRTLVSDGQIDWDALRRHDITERDLRAALRQDAHTDSLHGVKAVILEPNGKLSVVMK